MLDLRLQAERRTDTEVAARDMSDFPLGYERVPPTTWAYLSSLLLLAVYFKFNRAWSIRNVDLILVILLAPGLLFVHFGAVGRERVRGEIARILAASETDPATAAEQPEGATADGSSLSDAAGDDRDPIASPDDSGSSTDRTAPVGPTNRGSDPADEADAPRASAEDRLREAMAGAEGSGDAADQSLEGRDPRFDVLRDAVASDYFAARRLEHRGYLWLFLIGTLMLIRMLIDPMLVRRPLLEPNLTSGGLTFMGVSMLVFMLANLLTVRPVRHDLYFAPELTETRLWPEAEAAAPILPDGPGYRLLSRAPILPTLVDTTRAPLGTQRDEVSTSATVLARLTVTVSLLAIVIGMLLIGTLHFENFRMGVGIATLFLMLPYTVQMTGRVNHVLPAALLIWALVTYRLPLLSGVLIGGACGLVYYPLFLLPLWSSFYRERGLVRFWIGCGTSLAILALMLWVTGSEGFDPIRGLREMFGLWLPRHSGLEGIWALGWEPVFRLPIIAGSVAIAGALALWPSRKNLGTLMSGSCAVMIGVQFWQGHGGGLSMAWFLPLALLAIFRPNLEEKTAAGGLRARSGRAGRSAVGPGKAA